MGRNWGAITDDFVVGRSLDLQGTSPPAYYYLHATVVTDKSIDIYISVKGAIITLWPSHPKNIYSLDIDIEEVSSIPDGAVLFGDI